MSRIHFKTIRVCGEEEQDCPELQTAEAGSQAHGGLLIQFYYCTCLELSIIKHFKNIVDPI